MNSFEYTAPADLSTAVKLLGDTFGQAEVLAGGTDLLALMKDFVVTPARLVNIKKIAGLSDLSVGASGLSAGCLVTLDQMGDDARIQQIYPALAEALADAASPQIRNMATLGGNLCQRPRCWYFRNGFGLLAQDAAGNSLVKQGDNRYHAILGNTGAALFVSPSTIAPVLIALEAVITIQGPGGTRTLPLEKFYRMPASEQEREHDLRSNEIVTRIELPRPAGVMGYYEVRQKHSFDWPVATAAAVLNIKNKKVESASAILGHVAPIPWRAKEAESTLIGRTVTPDLMDRASRAGLQPASSLGRNCYKIQVARVCLQRALLRAAGFEVPPPHPPGVAA